MESYGMDAYLFGDEVWVATDLNAMYFVSNYGRVQSRGTKARILRQDLRGHYYAVRFRVNGTAKAVAVHHLVAAAFIGPRPIGMVVNHIDGHKSNNTPFNLEYITHRENIRHAFANGLCDSRRGTRHYCNKLSERQVREIIAALASGKRQQRELADEYKVSQQTIHKIKTKKRWKHISR